MTKRVNGSKRVSFERILTGPIVGFGWIAPETSKLKAGDKVRVTVELLAKTRKGR